MRTAARMSAAGFTLIQMLTTVVLLTAFMLLATRFFVSCMQLTTEAAKADATVTRLDAAVEQLRRDMWNARACDGDGSVLRIVPAAATSVAAAAAAPPIVWRVENTGSKTLLTRRVERPGGPPDVRHWRDLPGPIQLEGRGSALAFSGRDADGQPTLLVLTSQTVLAGARQ